MKTATRIMGQSAPSPRLTKSAALVLAVALSVPVFAVLTVIEAVFL